MKKIFLLIMLSLAASYSFAANLILTGKRDLSLAQVEQVAYANVKVSLSKEALNNIKLGYDVVLQAALNGKKVYGLTVGVGWNKDHPVFVTKNGNKVLSQDLIKLSKQFNLSSLRAHASGYGPNLDIATVRAAMLIRLNTFLNGEAGVSPEVAKIYLDYLNNGITPVVPSKGSVGEADITLASHIGLAMVGEWDVYYQGKIQPAKVVMKKLGIQPLSPVGKDFLSILSNNSLMSAKALLILQESKSFYKKQVKLFALMLQGYNGNVAPFSMSATQARSFPFMQQAAQDITKSLDGSYLFKPHPTRSLQDTLSYRSMAYTLGELNFANEQLAKDLLVQINHTDDNPLVLINGLGKGDNNAYMQQFLVGKGNKGAIVPTANFNFLAVTRDISNLNHAFAKLAEVMNQQLIRMANPDFTKLTRFLSDKNNNGHAFGAIQKPYAYANQEIKQLAQSQWYAGVSLAGNIEDTASWSNLELNNSQKILDNLYVIAAFQLIHGTQAIDLRQAQEKLKLSADTQNLQKMYRKGVPYFAVDVATTQIIEQSIKFWKAYR